MRTFPLPLVISLTFLALSSAAQAVVIMIDFVATAVSPSGVNNYNVQSATVGTDFLNLLDTANASTGISLDTSSNFTGGGLTVGVNATSGAAAAAGFTGFQNDSVMYSSTNSLLTFSGLSLSNTYTFTIIGSREGTGVGVTRLTPYTVTGANSGGGTLDAALNEANVVTVSGIAPTVAGVITLNVNGAVSGTGAGYLSAVRIDIIPIPEPSTPLLVLGVTAGLVSLRRRRH